MKTNWKNPDKRLVGGGGAAAIAFVCGGSTIAAIIISLFIRWLAVNP
jgi:hypothetical protein